MRAFVVAAMLAAIVAGASADIVAGNGKIETERRSVPAFASVGLSGSGALLVHKGAFKVEITCDSNILPYITTKVANGELAIGFKPALVLRNPHELRFDVTLPDLKGIRLSGSGEARVDPFSGDSFAASISGSGGIKAELAYARVSLECSGSGGYEASVKAKSLSLRCTGSGKAELSGSADAVDIDIAGSGDFRGRELSARDARVRVTGSANVDIGARNSLDVGLAGSGSLRYWGDPALKQRISGSGRITKAGD